MITEMAVDTLCQWTPGLQSLEHVDSRLSTPPNCRTYLQPISTFICHSAAGPTVHEKWLL